MILLVACGCCGCGCVVVDVWCAYGFRMAVAIYGQFVHVVSTRVGDISYSFFFLSASLVSVLSLVLCLFSSCSPCPFGVVELELSVLTVSCSNVALLVLEESVPHL